MIRPRKEIAAERESAAQLSAFIGSRRTGVKKRTPPSISDKVWDALKEEARAFAQSGTWEGASPRHFVALYDQMHEKVYGVACAELDKSARFFVSCKAKTMLDQQFTGDAGAMAAFFRWTWQREEWKEKNGKNDGGWRVTPWQQFNGKILTDYRVDLERQHRRTGT